MNENHTYILLKEQNGVIAKGTMNYCLEKREQHPNAVRTWIQTETGEIPKYIGKD